MSRTPDNLGLDEGRGGRGLLGFGASPVGMPDVTKKVIGIAVLLVVICLFTGLRSEFFWTSFNVENLLQRTSLFAIISIGVAFVIITGGIDLSIGSVIALTGTLLPMLLVQHGWSAPAALGAVIGMSLLIGLSHGLLITKLRLQPFVVTLCGLLIYRGLARWISKDQTQGFAGQHDSLRTLATGRPFSIPVPGVEQSVAVPAPLLIMLVIAVLAYVLLNYTIYGRYLLALGRSEQAARYSGIRTDRMVIMAYVISSLLAGVGGVLFALDVNSIQPGAHGNFYELYAIAAAVLGGCSLRGGEGSIVGVVIGAAIMRVLYNSINLLGISTTLEFLVIGGAILIGVVTDELVKRYAARRRARRQAALAVEPAAAAQAET